ncbi:MAG: hypothetical protein QXO27_04485 [Candidatus Aenigmatarchaeota archaeon]
MKGLSIVLMVLLGVLSVITAEGVYIFATISNIESVRRSVTEIGITTFINQVEFVKKSLNQALDYSFYQAIYNILKYGGYYSLSDIPPGYSKHTGDNLPCWRVYASTYIPDTTVNLNNAGLNIFNQYIVKIQEKTDVQIPTYKTTTNVFDTYITVSATSPNDLLLEKPNVTISDNADITRTIQTNFGKIVNLGRNNFVLQDSIGNIVTDAIREIKSENNLKDTGSDTNCGSCPSDEEVFITTNGMSTSDAEALIENRIRQKIINLDSTLDISGVNTELIIEDVKSDIVLSCTGCSIDDCCTWYCCCWDICCGGDPEVCFPCCCRSCCGGNWETKTCNFYYYGAAKVLVKMKDTINSHPVYDFEQGSTNFRSSQLRFCAVSGNANLISP